MAEYNFTIENKTSSGSDRRNAAYDENAVSGKGLFCIIC